MDRRLLERRRRVAEERARSNLGRLVRLLVVLTLAGLAGWFLQSPFLSVGDIRVEGSDRPAVRAILTESGVVEDRPMLLVDVGGAKAALEGDPWVAEATVSRDWPTAIVVEISERSPAAGLADGEGWWLVADDGTLLERIDRPPAQLGIIEASRSLDELDRAGAAAFLGALPQPYRVGARVEAGPEGLEGEVGGHRVRLGRPFDMEEKAAVVVALIESGIESGSVITVVAPASPAVLAPGAGSPPPDEETEAEP